VGDLSATRWTLVQAAQRGDEQALGALCEKYRPAMIRWLERHGAGPDAEDVAQEALLALVASALRGADAKAGSFRALVFAVTRNRLLKHLEKRGAKKRGPGKVQSLGDEEPSGPIERDDDFDREWVQNLVQRALARLKEEHASTFHVLKRFVLEGSPQAEIARELKVPVDNVKKLVSRGKRKVEGFLRDEVWAYAISDHDFEAEVAHLMKLLAQSDRHLLAP
jgi:RNA polymerase sigma factor (sigma-70 family)